MCRIIPPPCSLQACIIICCVSGLNCEEQSTLMRMRKALFWVHLVTGCAAGLVILVMCVTGVLLAFERQINDLADRRLREPVTVGKDRLPLDKLIDEFRTSKEGLPSTVTMYACQDEPVAFGFGRERIVYVDPYSGKALGEGSKQSRAFFASVELLHRSLGSSLRSRSVGRALTGACNLAFLGLLLTGLYLWLPKKWTAQHLRPATLLRTGLTGRARHWNQLFVAVFWCAVSFFLFVLC